MDQQTLRCTCLRRHLFDVGLFDEQLVFQEALAANVKLFGCYLQMPMRIYSLAASLPQVKEVAFVETVFADCGLAVEARSCDSLENAKLLQCHHKILWTRIGNDDRLANFLGTDNHQGVAEPIHT